MRGQRKEKGKNREILARWRTSVQGSGDEKQGKGKVRGSAARVLKYFMLLNAAAEAITRHKISEKKTSFLTVDNYVQKGTCGSRGE